jgi:hypothetical protein
MHQFRIYEVLVKDFPISLFTTVDYVPSKRELQLCRPPTVTVFEASLRPGVKIVDSPGPINENGNFFHDYALEFGERTTVVHVVGLHQVLNRVDEEISLFSRAYEISCEKAAPRVGLLFNQMDMFPHDLDILKAVVAKFIERIASLPNHSIPVRISLCSGLSHESSCVALTEMAQPTSTNFSNADELFLPYGVIPHQDKKFSKVLGADVQWNRSVFSNTHATVGIHRIPWTPQAFGLLGEKDKRTVITVMLAASRDKSPLKAVPSSMIFNILSYVVTIGS